jgi:capsule polysaccharide export protein KpsC/LpsZ
VTASVRRRTAFHDAHRLSYPNLEAGMTHNYRMTVDGSEFSVIDDLGATINVCKTEREAEQIMASCEHDDLMLDTARSLVEKAVTAYMRMHDLDRQAAFDWIREAAD